MLEILFGAEGETLRTFSTVRDDITIGADPRCELQLPPDGVAPVHCRLRRDDTGWIVEPRAAISINGVALTGPTYLGPTDRLQLGPIALHVKPVLRDASEQTLIEGARDDLAGRAVYADWLEERGQWDRAEFLRLTITAAALTPSDAQFAPTAIRIQKLAPCLDLHWRIQLASARVEGCKELRREFTCNMTWDRLTPTADPTVRSCGACKSEVHYCQSEVTAQNRAREGHCIVLDVAVGRVVPRPRRPPSEFPDDGPTANPGMYLPPPPPSDVSERNCGSCGALVPAGFRFCSRCGARS